MKGVTTTTCILACLLLIGISTSAQMIAIDSVTLAKELFTKYEDSIVFTIPQERKFDTLTFEKAFRMQLPTGLKGYQLQAKNLVFQYADEQYLMVCLNVNGNQAPGQWMSDGKMQDNLFSVSQPVPKKKGQGKGANALSNQQRVNQIFLKKLDIVGMANIKPENYKRFMASVNSFRVVED